jgi:hypothetical protein
MKIEVDFKTLYAAMFNANETIRLDNATAISKQLVGHIDAMEENLVDYHSMTQAAAHEHVADALYRNKLCYIKYGRDSVFAAIEFSTGKSPRVEDHGKAAKESGGKLGILWCKDLPLMTSALIRNGWLIVPAPKEVL